MIDILTSTLDNIHVNKNTAILLLDLKKAFGTVNHNILLNKRNRYGIRRIANKLFASFLANRKQYVLLNHTQSNYRHIKCDVPQGLVLGPLLFALYRVSVKFVPSYFYLKMTLLIKFIQFRKFCNKEVKSDKCSNCISPRLQYTLDNETTHSNKRKYTSHDQS